MKRYFYVLQAFIFSLLFIGRSSEDESTSTPTVQASKTKLFAIGTARMTRAASGPYLFTFDNIKSFNAQTREVIFQDFELTSLLFPIYRNIGIHPYGKVLLHISTFASSFNSQTFTDLSLVSESGRFYLSDCYPRNIEDNSQYVKENKAIQEAEEKRTAEWGEFLSILKKHGRLIE